MTGLVAALLAGCLPPLDPVYSPDACEGGTRWTVGAEGDFASVSDAVASTDVCDGDVIEVEQLGDDDIPIFLDRDVTVMGIDGVTLEGDGTGPVVSMSAGTLMQFTVTGGRPGIRVCRLDEVGGCLMTFDGTVADVVLRDLEIENNHNPGAYGGGVEVLGPDTQVLLERVNMVGNSAEAGGNLGSTSADTTIVDSVLEFGDSNTDGGGIAHTNGGLLTLENVTLRNNESFAEGGAIDVNDAWVTFDGVRMEDNSCGSDGCGAWLALRSGEDSRIDDLVAIHNETEGLSAASQLWLSGPAELHRVEVRDGVGGESAIAVEDAGFLYFTNGIIAGNEGDGMHINDLASNQFYDLRHLTVVAPGGDGIVVTMTTQQTSITDSFIGDADVGIRIVNPNGQVERSNMAYWRNDTQYFDGNAADDTDTEITATPGELFQHYHPDLDPESWDLHLPDGSPLIDAGDPNPLNDDPNGTRGDLGGYGGPDADFDWVRDDDDDGMWDGWETAFGLDPDTDDANLDPDSDGWDNLTEFGNRTRPDTADSDGDGCDEGTGTIDPDPVDPSDCS